jgi:inosose dehydratase
MKSLKAAQALRACAEIGYDSVELALMPGWPTEPGQLSAANRRELRTQLAEAGLVLDGLMENLREPADDAMHRVNLERLKAAAELGHQLSPQAPPVIETILGGKPADWQRVQQPLADRLAKWADVAAAARTVIAVKPHVANALHLPESALWLVRQVNSRWLKLAFDYSHFALRGLPLEQTVTALAPHTAFIHVKDCRGTAEKFEFLLPGEGTIDDRAYFALLKSAGYRGPLVVEISSQISNRPGYDPLAAARQSYHHLATVLRNTGLR